MGHSQGVKFVTTLLCLILPQFSQEKAENKEKKKKKEKGWWDWLVGADSEDEEEIETKPKGDTQYGYITVSCNIVHISVLHYCPF